MATVKDIARNAAEILLAKFSSPQAEPEVVTLRTEIAGGDSVKML